MGNIRRLRKKYQGPSHMWQKERIVEEKTILKEYGLVNKKEVWRATSTLARYKNLAKTAISSITAQSEKEAAQLLTKLKNLGLLSEGSLLSDVLKLSVKDVLERRLQTVVFRRGLSHSVKQARQFITHGHITVNGVAISSPSYLVTKAEELTVMFSPSSALHDDQHPERSAPIKAVETESEASSTKSEAAEKATESTEKKPTTTEA